VGDNNHPIMALGSSFIIGSTQHFRIEAEQVLDAAVLCCTVQ
jgi:hypothetical protein